MQWQPNIPLESGVPDSFVGDGLRRSAIVQMEESMHVAVKTPSELIGIKPK